MLSNKEKVEFLMKEKDLMRQELYLYIKTNFTMLVSFFTIFAAFLGIYFGKIDFHFVTPNALLLIIEQVGVLVLVLNLNLQCSIASLAGYIRSLEEKINYFSDENISQWESVIVKRYSFNLKVMSGSAVSSLFLSVMFFTAFVFFICLIQKTFGGYIFLLMHFFELIFIVILVWLAFRDKNKCYELTKAKNKLE